MAKPSDRELIVGEVYFRVNYLDMSRKYPVVDSLVFIGQNVSEEDTMDSWYFQFADSYAKAGSALDSTLTLGDRRVVCVGRNQLAEVLSPERLIEELKGAAARRGSA